MSDTAPLVERVEIAMEMVRSFKPRYYGLSEGVKAQALLDEIFDLLASVQRDLYGMEKAIAKIEDLAEQVFERAETAEDRTRFLLGLLGGKK